MGTSLAGSRPMVITGSVTSADLATNSVYAAEIAAFAGLSYEEVAFRVMRPFVGEAFDDATFRHLIDKAYAGFGHDARHDGMENPPHGPAHGPAGAGGRAQQQVYPRKDGSIGHQKPGIHGVHLDCTMGYGSASFVTGTIGFVAVSRLLDKHLLRCKRRL